MEKSGGRFNHRHYSFGRGRAGALAKAQSVELQMVELLESSQLQRLFCAIERTAVDDQDLLRLREPDPERRLAVHN